MTEKKHGGKRPGAGRPAFKPEPEHRKYIEHLAAFGVTVDNMVLMFEDRFGVSISDETLRKHFEPEIKTGKTKAHVKVANALFTKATGGDTTAAIFWLKTQARWTETVKVENTGKDGGPIEQHHTHHVQELSDDELERIARGG